MDKNINRRSLKKGIGNKSLLIVMLLLMSCTFALALDDLGSFKEGETVRIKQTCASCTYVNFSISYPNSSFAIENEAMITSGASVWYYDFSDTGEAGRYDVTGVGDMNNINTSFATYFDITRTGDPTPTGVPTLQGFLVLLIFGTAWFFLFMAGRFRDVGPRIFFMLLSFLFIGGALLTTSQVLMSYNVSQGLSNTLTSLIFVVLTVFFIVFLYTMIRQTIIVLDMLKIRKGLKWDGSPSMKGHTKHNPGF